MENVAPLLVVPKFDLFNPAYDLRGQLLRYVEANRNNEFLVEIAVTRRRARIRSLTNIQAIHPTRTKFSPDHIIEANDIVQLKFSPEMHRKLYELATQWGILFRMKADGSTLDFYFSFQTIAIISQDYYLNRLFRTDTNTFLVGMEGERQTTVPVIPALFRSEDAISVLSRNFPITFPMHYLHDDEVDRSFNTFFGEIIRQIYGRTGFGCCLKRSQRTNHAKNNGIYYLLSYPTLLAFYVSEFFQCFDVEKLKLNQTRCHFTFRNYFVEPRFVLNFNDRALKIKMMGYALKYGAFVAEPYIGTLELEIGMQGRFQGRTKKMLFYDGEQRVNPVGQRITQNTISMAISPLNATTHYFLVGNEHELTTSLSNDAIEAIRPQMAQIAFDDLTIPLVIDILKGNLLTNSQRKYITKLVNEQSNNFLLIERFINQKLFPTTLSREFYVKAIQMGTGDFFNLHMELLAECAQEFNFSPMYAAVLKQSYDLVHVPKLSPLPIMPAIPNMRPMNAKYK